jgi:hypothetical protein
MNVESGSSVATYLSCPRKYYYKYVQLLDPPGYSSALAIGSIIHAIAEDTNRKDEAHQAMNKVRLEFARKVKEGTPAFAEYQKDLIYAIRIGRAWADYWSSKGATFNAPDFIQDNLEFISVEREWKFDVTLGSKLAGKSDGYLKHKIFDKHFLYELKTASDRDREGYVNALQSNAQINNNLLALKNDKLPYDGVLYDIIWKPAIRQKMKETEEEFHQRTQDIIALNPEKYFERVFIFRNGDKLDSHMVDIRQQLSFMETSHKTSAWYRNTGSCKMYNQKCTFFEMCVDDNQDMEAMFDKKEKKLPELSLDIQNEKSSTRY